MIKKKRIYLTWMIVFWSLSVISWVIPDGIPGEEFILSSIAILFTILFFKKDKHKKRIKTDSSINESLIRLIQIAGDDVEFKKQILSIISMGRFHRESVLNKIINEMKLKNERKDFIECCSILKNDDICKKLKSYLNK